MTIELRNHFAGQLMDAFKVAEQELRSAGIVEGEIFRAGLRAVEVLLAVHVLAAAGASASVATGATLTAEEFEAHVERFASGVHAAVIAFMQSELSLPGTPPDLTWLSDRGGRA